MHVPYRGNAPALNALISKEIQLMFTPPTVAVQHVDTGRLRAIAFTGPVRLPSLPDVPTVAESGLAGFNFSGTWHAWFAPARTPAAIIDKIHLAAQTATAMPKDRDFIRASGYEPDHRSPAEYRSFIASEVKRYQEVLRAANIKPVE
jgi:tripartite-type tricarboxylate transporter receptor subunit TctC